MGYHCVLCFIYGYFNFQFLVIPNLHSHLTFQRNTNRDSHNPHPHPRKHHVPLTVRLLIPRRRYQANKIVITDVARVNGSPLQLTLMWQGIYQFSRRKRKLSFFGAFNFLHFTMAQTNEATEKFPLLSELSTSGLSRSLY